MCDTSLLNPVSSTLASLFAYPKPPQSLGTPRPYRSPELMLDIKASIGSDVWALACTLFQIGTGRKLFEAFDNEDDDYLDRSSWFSELCLSLGGHRPGVNEKAI